MPRFLKVCYSELFCFSVLAMPCSRKSETGDLHALEQFISEENELQALGDELAEDQRAQHIEESSYGDDEDYESLFVDLLSHDDLRQSEANQPMDMSRG